MGRRSCLAEAAVVLEGKGNSQQPQVVAVGEELLTLQKCTRHMWATQLSSITLGRPENLQPVPGKMGSSPRGRAFTSAQSDIKPKVRYAFALWPWKGHLVPPLQNGGTDFCYEAFRGCREPPT